MLEKREVDLLVLFTKLGGKMVETDRLAQGESMSVDGTVYVGVADD